MKKKDNTLVYLGNSNGSISACKDADHLTTQQIQTA